MADQWRLLVVEDEEPLNWSIVNSLRKDGYDVQGVLSGAEAIRVLWSEECNVVISDLKTPGADSFELLQWLRTYRPHTRMIVLAPAGSPSVRTQALESGAVSYLEKPLDMHLLKEELRHLLSQTGFSANLDSFDLLDVIQIITLSRKSIALLVNTGLEERGVLRFQSGELIWAEYGILRGEEAFFALAAHKNGTVIHQPWNEQITPNVTQPLSRLIFQALQYRTKYAVRQQMSGEHETVPIQLEEGDRPFSVLEDEQGNGSSASADLPAKVEPTREWWQQTGRMTRVQNGHRDGNTRQDDSANLPAAELRPQSGNANIVPSTIRKTVASQRTDLPTWLTDQPTNPSVSAVQPTSYPHAAQVPTTPVHKPSPAEWQPPQPQARTTGAVPGKQSSGPQPSVPVNKEGRRTSSPEWQPGNTPLPTGISSGPLQSLVSPHKTGDDPGIRSSREDSGPLPAEELNGAQHLEKRNYSALISALQTLGYSITGFIAAGVASLDGQPIAQVAVDDLDISRICGHFSNILRTMLASLDQGAWGEYEDTIITSADRHILLRLCGSERSAFQMLITTREADPVESLRVMANVEGAISAAL